MRAMLPLLFSVSLPASAQDLPAGLPGMEVGAQAGPSGVGQTVQVEGAPFIINGAGQEVKHACGGAAGRDVVINGAGSRVLLTGDCREVTVNGATLVVAIASVEKLIVSGMSNAVTWAAGPKGGSPAVENLGMGNAVKQAPMP
jgi:hypothetical protein